MTNKSGSASFYIVKKDDEHGETARGPYTVLGAHSLKDDDERVVTDTLLERMRNPPPQPTLRSRLKLSTIIWALGIGLGVCLAVGVGLLVSKISEAGAQKGEVEQIIDHFMCAMANKDVDAAYALFVTRYREQTPLSNFEEMLEGNNYVLFEGYQHVEVTYLYLATAMNTDPNRPQGKVIEAKGTILYEGGLAGSFTATLEKENDVWKLFGIYVTVPPEKFDSPGKTACATKGLPMRLNGV